MRMAVRTFGHGIKGVTTHGVFTDGTLELFVRGEQTVRLRRNSLTVELVIKTTTAIAVRGVVTTANSFT